MLTEAQIRHMVERFLGWPLREEKTLGNSDVNGARKNVPDLQVFGDGDAFKLICKASSQSEGWMKSTKAMEIGGAGVVVQVTTQQRNPDGSYAVAEALTFVPGAAVADHYSGEPHAYDQVTARSIIVPGYANRDLEG